MSPCDSARVQVSILIGNFLVIELCERLELLVRQKPEAKHCLWECWVDEALIQVDKGKQTPCHLLEFACQVGVLG
jgi:hypothetical protein